MGSCEVGVTLQRCLKTKGRYVLGVRGLVLRIHWERGVNLGRETPFSSGPFLGRVSAVYCQQAELPVPGEMSGSVLKGESGVMTQHPLQMRNVPVLLFINMLG